MRAPVDGCLDLVLVHETSKKNFQRYLRRHGNDKDQVGDVDRSMLLLNNAIS